MPLSPEEIQADLARKKALRLQKDVAAPSQNGHGPSPEPPAAREPGEPLPEERGSVAVAPAHLVRTRRPLTSSVQDIHRTPPHSDEAERGVLGSMLQPRTMAETIVEVRKRIDATYFYVPAHCLIFESLCALFDDQGTADLITFTQYLRDTGKLETVGDASFLTELYTFVPTAANVTYYLEIMRDKYILRQIIATSSENVRKAYEEQDEVNTLVDEIGYKSAFIASLVASDRRSSLTIRTLSELIGMTFDEADNYFGDRIIAAGQACTLLGPGGIGKSRLSMQMAVCMITGRPFLDVDTRAPGMKWLFVQTENNNRRLHFDLKNMITALSLTPAEIEEVNRCLFIHTLENDIDSFLNLINPQNYTAVNALIQDVKPDFIQWDPLNSLTDNDLNSDMDMRAVVSAISRITRQGNHNRVPFVLHHSLTGKVGAARAVGWDKASYGRNSKVLQAWTRAQINLAPRDPDNPNLLVMSCGKNNNGRPFPEIGVAFHEELGIYVKDESFDPEEFREEVGISKPGQFKAKYTKDMLLDELSFLEGIRPSVLKRTMDETHGMSKSHFYRFARELHDQKLITERDGKWFKNNPKS